MNEIHVQETLGNMNLTYIFFEVWRKRFIYFGVRYRVIKATYNCRFLIRFLISMKEMYRVSQTFVPLISCSVLTFGQNFIFT